jgi:uncharacterized protein (DUF2252 family)
MRMSTRARHPGTTVAERATAGKALRAAVPRSAHAAWRPSARRTDPLALLEASDRGRLPALIPIRYGRMSVSPFAFLRGAAAVMAADLASTPVTGLRVQACGDCHLGNFGGFATPERNFVFDINDFDETLPAPWEWDLKRLAASIVVAGREIGLRPAATHAVCGAAVASYREHMREYARMHVLDTWYARIPVDALVARTPDARARRRERAWIDAARAQTSGHLLPRVTEVVRGLRRIVEHRPFVYHAPNIARHAAEVTRVFAAYRASLPAERRRLLERFHLADVAMKVVGVGSVGTRCAIALLLAEGDDALFLQFKEARASVLEPYAGRSAYRNQGERVVVGQRLMQAASDLFLGWAGDGRGRWFYFRQLKDMKWGADVARMTEPMFSVYAETCGWALSRAHARSGDAAAIAGYLGAGTTFDEAVAKFASTYADQTERDHAALVKAVRRGRVQARVEELR